MKKTSATERREFWKFMGASGTFEQAEKACDYILRESIDERHPLSLPLMVAVVVLYSRPFKQRKVVRLIEKMVPKEFKSTHDFVILLRDKMFAHADTDGPDYDGNQLNKVIITVKGDLVEFGFSYLQLRPEEIKRVKDLSCALAKKCAFHGEKIWNRHMRQFSEPEGEYEVNLSSGDGPFLVPLRRLPARRSESEIS